MNRVTPLNCCEFAVRSESSYGLTNATVGCCRDQIINQISSKYATGHIGVDLGLNFVAHKYVWGVTFEKRETAEMSRKFRVLLVQADFLEHIDKVSVDRLVGAGQDGYSTYRRDRFSKLKTLRVLWKNMDEAKGKALFLVGELEIAVPSPGGGSRLSTDWSEYYKKRRNSLEPPSPKDLDTAVQLYREPKNSGCREESERLTLAPANDSFAPSVSVPIGKEAGSAQNDQKLKQERARSIIQRKNQQGNSRKPAGDITLAESRAGVGTDNGAAIERAALQRPHAPAPALSPRSPRSPRSPAQERYEAYLQLLRETTSAKRSPLHARHSGRRPL